MADDIQHDDWAPVGANGGVNDWGSVGDHGEVSAVPVLEAFGHGLRKSGRDVMQSVDVAAGRRPQEAPEETEDYTKPLEWGDAVHLDRAIPKLAYGMGASGGSLAGGVAGGMAGATIGGGPESPTGIIGGVIGGGIGAAAGSMVQAIGPEFARALKEEQDPDAAFNLALKRTAATGAISGAGWAAFGWAPFQSTVKNVLFQAFGVQPAISSAGKVGTNVMEGRPATEGVVDDLPSSVIGTLVPMAGQHIVSRITPRRAAPRPGEPVPEVVPPEAGAPPAEAAPEAAPPRPPAPPAPAAAPAPSGNPTLDRLRAVGGEPARPAPVAPPPEPTPASAATETLRKIAGPLAPVPEAEKPSPIQQVVESMKATPEPARDPYEVAKELVLKKGVGSASYLGRTMQIPFADARAYIERMAAEGLLGPAGRFGQRPLATPPEPMAVPAAPPEPVAPQQMTAPADLPAPGRAPMASDPAYQAYVEAAARHQFQPVDFATFQKMLAAGIDPMPTTPAPGITSRSTLGPTSDRAMNPGGDELDMFGAPIRPEPTEPVAPAAGSVTPVPAFSPAVADAPPNPGRPAGVFTFDASTLKTDPARFQYKGDTDAEGVNTRLKGVKEWDQTKAGQIVAYEDADGQVYVADGHQRTGLARRIKGANPDATTPVTGVLYRAKDGFTPDQVMALAAAKNLAEGSGSTVDAAKILRTHPEVVNDSLSLSDAKIQEAQALAALAPDAWGMVVNGHVEPNHAAEVGKILPDEPALQMAAMQLLAKAEPRSTVEAESLVRQVRDSELFQGGQEDMFGTAELARSLVVEKSKVVAAAIRLAATDKKVFGALLKEADRIAAAGNKLKSKENAARHQDAASLMQQIQAVAYRTGPVGDALTKAARAVAEGKNAGGAARAFLEEVRQNGGVGQAFAPEVLERGRSGRPLRRAPLGDTERLATKVSEAAGQDTYDQMLARDSVRSKVDERTITNPVGDAATPERKLRVLQALTKENVPVVQDIMRRVDAEVPGSQSKFSIKEPRKIIEKASRPEILAEKPWHGVEHIRDSLRFKTVLNDIRDLPKIMDILKQSGVELVKVDVKKFLEPKEWGFPIVAFDLRMPNGQLVEYYTPLKEVESAKKVGHIIFEKWRNIDRSKMTWADYGERKRDVARSRALYGQAKEEALARTGATVADARASLAATSALDRSSISSQPAEIIPASVNGPLAGSQDSPGRLTNASPPVNTSSAPPSVSHNVVAKSDTGSPPGSDVTPNATNGKVAGEPITPNGKRPPGQAMAAKKLKNASPEATKRIEAAIEGKIESLRADGKLPPAAGGGAGGGPTPPAPPAAPAAPNVPPAKRGLSRIYDYIHEKVGNLAQRMGLPEIFGTLQMGLSPMAHMGASVEARAIAKDFANALRLADWQWERMNGILKRDFTTDRLAAMWEAADEESVMRQTGETPSGAKVADMTPDERKQYGLGRLSQAEREVVQYLQDRADAAWERAKAAGMIDPDAEGLPSYVPRMVVMMGEDGSLSHVVAKKDDKGRALSGFTRPLEGKIGNNVRTTTDQLRRREHLTTGDTEAAAKAKFGANAAVVRDIRSLALATAHLEKAVAGKTMVNEIARAGRATGKATVVEGGRPAEGEWFTIPNNPAFNVWRPELVTDPYTGKMSARLDADGQPVMNRVPMFIRGDFEGPLRAVLSTKSNAVYRGLMGLKGRAMMAIMYSPLIHNMVEYGRAIPAAPLKVASGYIYFMGNTLKNDPAQMREAINAGLVPIGHRAGFQDITSVMNLDDVKPGRSLLAKGLGKLGDKVGLNGDVARRAIDTAGDVWHNTLLWDRVADLQAGLYGHFRDKFVAQGVDPLTAQRMAAHMANRYAGALPKEAMSNFAQRAANLILFSRSFTMGNLGAMKDAVTGLPRDLQAQIMRDAGVDVAKAAVNKARLKTIAMLATDIGLMYGMNSLLQSMSNMVLLGGSLDDEMEGYARRFHEELQILSSNPLRLLGTLGRLSATADNEPGKQDRILVGKQKDDTGIYARNPIGKIGEEFTGWASTPLDMMHKKLSTFARPLAELWSNDKGFGRHLYDPNPQYPSDYLKNAGRIAWAFIGSQVPVDSIASGINIATGNKQSMDAYKVIGPLAGITFSKGAPGGPAVGEMFAAEDAHREKVNRAMPDIRDLIRVGKEDEARQKMDELGMSPKSQQNTIQTTLNPGVRLKAGAKKISKDGTDEQIDRFNRARDRWDRIPAPQN